MQTLQTTISFTKGVDERFEASALPEGSASLIENWVPEQSGGLRARVGWLNSGTTGAPATRKARGIGYLASPTNRYIVAQNDTTEYDLFYIPKATISGGTWVALESVGAGAGVADPTKFVSFASGLGNIFYTTNEFTLLRRWDGTNPATTIAASKPGRVIHFHKNRLFTGGSTANPYRMWFSDLGDYTTWGANSYIDVNQDDGEPIESFATFDNGLLIGKETSLHFLTGSGPDTFQLHPLDAGGVAPGNTLVPTPYGCVVVGREQVWLFQGGVPIPISKQVETSYGMTGTFMSAAYQDGFCYITDEGSGTVFAYNLTTNVWHVEKLSTATEGPAVLFAQGQNLLAGPRSATTGSLVWYRTFPAASRTRDASLSEVFKANTPEIWLGGPMGPGTIRHVYLKIRQRGGDASQTGLTVTPYRNGTAGTAQTVAPKASARVFRHRLDFGGDAYSLQLRFSQTVGSSEAALMDIEQIDIEYQQEEPR